MDQCAFERTTLASSEPTVGPINDAAAPFDTVFERLGACGQLQTDNALAENALVTVKADSDLKLSEFFKTDVKESPDAKTDTKLEQVANPEQQNVASSIRFSDQMKDHELHELANRIKRENRRKDREAMRKLAQASDAARTETGARPEVGAGSSPMPDSDSSRQRRRRSRIDYAKMHDGAIYFAAADLSDNETDARGRSGQDEHDGQSPHSSFGGRQGSRQKRAPTASANKRARDTRKTKRKAEDTDADSKHTEVSAKESDTDMETKVKVKANSTKTAKEPDAVPSGSDSDDSDSDSEDDDNGDEDEDMSTIYCLCRRPYGKRFMIACDRCNDWFHGDCVGVSRRRGRQLAARNAEFVCPLCAARARLDAQFPSESTTERERRFEEARAQLVADAQAAAAARSGNDTKRVRADRKKQKRESAVPPKKAKLEEDEASSSGLELTSEDEDDNVRLSDLRRAATAAVVTTTTSSAAAKKSRESESKAVVETKTSESKANKESKTGEPKTRDPKTVSERRRTVSTSESLKGKSLDDDDTDVGTTADGETDSDAPRCRSRSCNKPLTTQSVYCARRCVEAYVRDALQVLRKANRNVALADYDRIPVVNRRLGKVLRGSDAPTVSNLSTFLERYTMFEVVLPTSSVGASGSNKPASAARSNAGTSNVQKSKPAAYAKPTVSSSTKAKPSAAPAPATTAPAASKPAKLAAAVPAKPSSAPTKPAPAAPAESGALPVTESRIAVRRDIGRTLNERAEKADDVYLSPSEIRKLAVAIEDALFATCAGAGSKQSEVYRTRSQRIVDALRDPSNGTLARRILNAQLRPAELVRMNEEELRFVPTKRVGTTSAHSVTLPKPAASTSASGNTAPKAPARLPQARDTTSEHGLHAFDFDCRTCVAQARKDEQERRLAAQTAEKHAKAALIGTTPIPIPVAIPTPVPPTPSTTTLTTRQERSTSSNTEPEQRTPVAATGPPDAANAKPGRVEYTVDTVRVEPPFEAHPLANVLPTLWTGMLSCNELESFTVRVLPVSGSLCAADLPEKLRLCGRIDDRSVLRYLVSVRRSANRSLVVGRLIATNSAELAALRTFCCSFFNRSRFGVVAFPPVHVKDLYIAPIEAVPDELLPFEGPGLADPPGTETPIKLVCLVVKHRDAPSVSPAPSSGSGSAKPTSINAAPSTSKHSAPSAAVPTPTAAVRHPSGEVERPENSEARTPDSGFYKPPPKRSRLSSQSSTPVVSTSPRLASPTGNDAGLHNAPESPSPNDDPLLNDDERQSVKAAASTANAVISDTASTRPLSLAPATSSAPVAIPLSAGAHETSTPSVAPSKQPPNSDLREMISTVSSIVNLIQQISNKQQSTTTGSAANENATTAAASTTVAAEGTPKHVSAASGNARSTATPASASNVPYPFSVSQLASRQMLATTIRPGTPSAYATGSGQSTQATPAVRSSLGADDEYTPDFVGSDYRPSQAAEYRPQEGADGRPKARRPSRWDT